MAKIVKISSKHSEVKTEELALDLGNDYFLTLNGEFKRGAYLNVKGTRGVPEIVKKAFSEVEKSYKKQLKLQEKKKALELEYEGKIRQEKVLQQEILKNAIKEMGFVDFEEFKNIFGKALSEKVKSCMDTLNFRIDTPVGILYSDGYLYISKYKMIQKYFRNASFLYTEYDGTVSFNTDAEKDKSYQELLNRYSSKLPLKNCEFTEDLSLGDKDTLFYTACYKIRIEKPLTEIYAKELAESICQN